MVLPPMKLFPHMQADITWELFSENAMHGTTSSEFYKTFFSNNKATSTSKLCAMHIYGTPQGFLKIRNFPFSLVK